MTPVRARAIGPVAALALVAALAGCSSGGSAGAAPGGVDAATSVAGSTTSTIVAVDVGGAPTTTAVVPTSITGTTMIDNTPVTAADGPVQIDVMIGADSSPDRVELARVGASVTLNVTNPDTSDTIVVEGIGMQQKVKAGVQATFNFKVRTAGIYEVKSTATGEVLVVIQVA